MTTKTKKPERVKYEYIWTRGFNGVIDGEVLNEFGMDGWILVSVTIENGMAIGYFKRPIAAKGGKK